MTQALALPRHHSVTHLHLLACLNTLLDRRLSAEVEPGPMRPLRVLDVGCGAGRLVGYLQTALPMLRPDRRIEVYGFDIVENAWGVSDEYLRAISHLERSCPGVAWRERLRLISSRDPWPFPDQYFDLAVSSLVLEHVEDVGHFLSSLRRVLRDDGSSVHVFPLAHCVDEGHVKVPFAHWFHDADVQRAWIELANRVGIGRWRTDREIFLESDLGSYARSQSAFLNRATFYRTFRDLSFLCQRHGLSASHRFTAGLFSAKLRDVLRRPPALRYRARSLLGVTTAQFLILRYLSAATLVIEPVTYDVAARIHAEAEARAAELV